MYIKYLIEFTKYFGDEFLKRKEEQPQRNEHTITCLDLKLQSRVKRIQTAFMCCYTFILIKQNFELNQTLKLISVILPTSLFIQPCHVCV